MAIQRTYSMLKPGVLHRRLVGEVIARIERKGLKIVGLKMITISRETAQKHYAEHAEKPFFESLVSYITSGPVVAMVIEGDDAISLLRKLCGATKVEDALPGTIRGDYAAHTNFNIIHSSDSVESAEREINIFFKPEEITAWTDGNGSWL